MLDWFNTLTAGRALSPEHAAALEDQGFVVLPRVMRLEQVEALAQAYDASVLEATGSRGASRDVCDERRLGYCRQPCCRSRSACWRPGRSAAFAIHEGGEMRTGLTAGGGMFLGMIFGIVFDHLVLGMLFGLIVGAAAARRRRARAAGSD